MIMTHSEKPEDLEETGAVDVAFIPKVSNVVEVYRGVTVSVYCTRHHIARCTVCTGTSNAELVSQVSFRPEDAVVSRTNQRRDERRAEFEAGVRYTFSLKLGSSWLTQGILEELVWNFDAALGRIERGDLS